MMRFVVWSKKRQQYVKNGTTGWTSNLQEATIYGNYALNRGYWSMDLKPVFITLVEGYPEDIALGKQASVRLLHKPSEPPSGGLERDRDADDGGATRSSREARDNVDEPSPC